MSNGLSKVTHKMVKKLFYKTVLEGEICTTIIKSELDSDQPSMIARFGSTEIKAILYPQFPFFIRPFVRKRIFGNMFTLSGFFPSNEQSILKFSKMMLEDMKLLDVLGCWRIEERFLQKYFPLAKRIKLSTLEPYLQKDPWSEVLKDKKVLVIHPFNTTIENQYFKKREQLFSDKRVLPQFKSFETIRAVQTIAGTDSTFSDWFEALDSMKAQMDKKDFDIAIIGCGAYGFSLAAHAKRMGKKAIHLGGPTQMLFGIKGKRWIENENFKDIINDCFVFPGDTDKIANASKVEDGCYW
ncbi:hypothetical protein [Flavobacterium cellulosilyticum]|uniref:Uncharacterized protein n=1 Tax=Flavobacterium cellulosilyticum TaxID=2541731 RepID=A0A4R5C5N8_9FLAO|nr:hypothetical protein [Flavobacterium cellulosilyticum]TDD95071.1 hypothetical protein E0F76_14925 [Flavobacterium cellulosilyticum]